MSATQALEIPPPPVKEVQQHLKEIADLLCPSHQHIITEPSILPDEQIRHSMTMACRQKGKVVWHVRISADCLEKEIRRCKVFSTSDSSQGYPGAMTFETLSTWEGLQCDDILWLIRIGHLKEGWWEENPSCLSDQHRGYTRQNHPDAGLGSHNYVAYSETTLELPLAPSENKDKDYNDETVLRDETLSKTLSHANYNAEGRAN